MKNLTYFIMLTFKLTFQNCVNLLEVIIRVMIMFSTIIISISHLTHFRIKNTNYSSKTKQYYSINYIVIMIKKHKNIWYKGFQGYLM